MHKTANEAPIIDWARVHFGIEDADELHAVLADPSEMLALLDVIRAGSEDEIPAAKAHALRLT